MHQNLQANSKEELQYFLLIYELFLQIILNF